MKTIVLLLIIIALLLIPIVPSTSSAQAPDNAGTSTENFLNTHFNLQSTCFVSKQVGQIGRVN